MRVYLNVDFNDARNAKRLGARWSPGHKRWYVENVEDLRPFLRWMSPHHRAAHEPAKTRVMATLDKQQRLKDREKRKQEAEIRRQRAQAGRVS